MADMEFDALKKAMDKYGEDLIVELAKQLRIADKIATKQLVNSLDYELIEVLGTIAVNIKALDYLSVVDGGRKPNRKAPPQGAILKWINVKPLPKWKDKNGRPISRKSQAFIIARSIGKKGIKPTNVIKKSMNKVVKIQNELIAKAAAEDISQLVRNVLLNVK